MPWISVILKGANHLFQGNFINELKRRGRVDRMIFSEDSRVKIPCILHLARLGYQYLSLKNATWDEDTNIFPDIFRESIARINPGIERDDIERLLDDVKLTLDKERLSAPLPKMICIRCPWHIHPPTFSRNMIRLSPNATRWCLLAAWKTNNSPNFATGSSPC